ncbi:hypothetical protein R2R35_04850 [Anaerocolumna sp. AGMB13020]|uniref:hypothetical protein n=1 Tax=Anaerocolumna sp. AGMB13020 TaxID=3081750 RepID=UPI0029557607|nr:hypothetical protein [Anaerocolumna sp. AGMB13020]WOO37832.1 hypothetical protein R2R35_04850 [Anaerocolumna sp. AGMB13020]
MSYLSSLVISLSSYNESLKKAEAELKEQKIRREAIKRIISDLSINFDYYAGSITKSTGDISNGILDGVKGSRNMTQLSYVVEKEREQEPDADAKLSSAKYNLLSEKSVTENKITELETQITSLKNQISSTEAAIRTEERRLEEERREAERRDEQRREEERARAAGKKSVN